MPAFPIILLRAIGGAGAILLMETLSRLAHTPLMTVPFATSIVMIMGSPDAPPARLRCLVGGHLICATCGIALTLLLGFDVWVAALAIGVAIALMHLLDAFHPPAGISPLIIVSAKAGPLFILSPVLAGAAVLAAYAVLYHHSTGEKWPKDLF